MAYTREDVRLSKTEKDSTGSKEDRERKQRGKITARDYKEDVDGSGRAGREKRHSAKLWESGEQRVEKDIAQNKKKIFSGRTDLPPSK